MLLLQWLIVGVITETIKQGSYLYTFLALLSENVKEARGDGIVAEVEVFQVNAALCLPNGLEHIGELILAGHQQLHMVVGGESDTLLPHLADEERV